MLTKPVRWPGTLLSLYQVLLPGKDPSYKVSHAPVSLLELSFPCGAAAPRETKFRKKGLDGGQNSLD